jgi:hypothetical protein
MILRFVAKSHFLAGVFQRFQSLAASQTGRALSVPVERGDGGHI